MTRWISWFLNTKGNVSTASRVTVIRVTAADIEQEYFAEVDEDYILDRFNLTGLNGEVVQEYGRALDLITDSLGMLFIRVIVVLRFTVLTTCRRRGPGRRHQGGHRDIRTLSLWSDPRSIHRHITRSRQDG